MDLGKVQARGQVTIPQDVRRAAGIAPGDVLLFAVPAPGELTLTLLRRHTSMHEVIARFGVRGSLDPRAWGAIGDDIGLEVLGPDGRLPGP